MAKVLIGLLAAVVLTAAGFFGFEFYVQHRVAGEVDTAFAQLRASGGKASHGNVSFDLWHHTIVIADIAAESVAQPPVSIKVASFTASGVRQQDPARFSADSIDIADIEVSAGMTILQAPGHISYKAPRITVKDYSGPARLAPPPASTSPIDLYRFALAQFAEIGAASVSLPNISYAIDVSGATPLGADVTDSGCAIEGVRGGKIATMKCAGMAFTINTQQADKTDKFSGSVADLVAYDIDTTALAAVLDPQNVDDDSYHRAYRQVSVGAYTVDPGRASPLHVEGITIDDVGLRPSGLQVQSILAMMPPPGSVPTPAQTRDMMEKMAGFYEGIHIGNAEIRGMAADTPGGPFKLAAIRYSMENGKGDFVIEGLDGQLPNGPLKVERFALKSLNSANFLRLSAQYAPTSRSMWISSV
jgi:hypothetical protein